MEHFAVIDLGSNSARMTITAIHDDGTFDVVAQEKEMVRLSEKMGEEKVLQEAAIKRTTAALKGFAEKAAEYSDVKMRAVATAATRQATNQKKFLAHVKEVAGIELEVISGNQEAYYDYLGIINTLPVTNCVVIDTGGGSTELVLVQNGHAVNVISLPYGAVNLSERFFPSKDTIKAGELFQLMTSMDKLYNGVWWLRRGHNLPIVALGGSNRTIAKIERRSREIFDFENLHGFKMRDSEVYAIFKDVVSKDLKERGDIPGLSRERADIIVGGMTPLISLMRFLDSDRLIFSQYGLREGIFYEHFSEMQKEGLINGDDRS
ncbi:exopolyphosphatase [Listeria floridensis FSL S10-1187]|uniref:Exopolyphosphatase n=1 Tax=Listeria floridensis FSL S10-1187 TaxID=1265817 RepID=A0ABP3AZ36_9LIST|nr:Ppx/GppA family phosphatase [Listeria floridensis]EUJ32759.1 exopolyphosphatase [Listeria floridensis FSL S10-1187]